AAMTIGATPAGIYFSCSAEEIAYILNHSEAPIVLAETEEHWARIEARLADLPALKTVVMMRGATADHDIQIGWDDFVAKGVDGIQAELKARRDAIKPEDAGTLVYTSGTTGPPKAVVLSYGALSWTSTTLLTMFGVEKGDRIMSYLPLAHIAEATNSIHNHVFGGYEVWFVRDLTELAQRLGEVRPSTIFGVPRVWQKIHEGLQAKLGEATGVKAKLAQWSLKVGREAALKELGGETVGGMLAMKRNFADKLVLSKIRVALGLDECRLPVSGAAPISREVLEFFASLGIIIYEVYGQSEDCGPTTFNVPGAVKLGTVGRPIPGLELRIAADDEVEVRAPSLFDGYLKNQAATDETLVDGWMKTGDLGRLDNEGFLTIIGRKKDIMITAGGKNIAPANLENDLMDIPLVEHAVVIGEGRKFLSAVVTVSEEALQSAEDKSPDAVRAAISAGVDEMNERYAQVEQIREFRILNRPLTIDDGELTPTLKVKRNIVTANHASVIEEIYA
ncbi:MAG: AMP-binding protein, partial [Pseudomonadota bacterium]